jgi:hypothetical protein
MEVQENLLLRFPDLKMNI